MVISRFDRALSQGKEYEIECRAAWERIGYTVTPFGAEEFQKKFHDLLKLLSDRTSKTLRMLPDGAITSPTGPTALYDAKNSSSISKDSYSFYKEWHDRGNLVIICINRADTDDEYWVPVDQLKLEFGSHDTCIPSDTDGWIRLDAFGDPRTPVYDPKKYQDYRKWCSCTPFKSFDFEKMERYQISSDEKRKFVVGCIFSNLIPPETTFD